MLVCDICTQEVLCEDDMKSHMLLIHMEEEVSCPLCTIPGLTYDELNFHIHTAHEDMLDSWNDVSDCTGPEISYSANCIEENGLSEETCNDMSLSKSLQAGNLQSVAVSCDPSSSALDVTDSNAMKEKSKHHKFESDIDASESPTPCDMDIPPECPFCCRVETSVEVLEFHVRTEHADILDTPTKGDAKQYECPMCSLVCSSCQILEEHVNLHMEESNLNEGSTAEASSDLYLARKLQTEEDKRRREEELLKEKEEFQKLQKQFGLDNSGGFKQQSLQNLEKAVARGRMQPMDFHVQRTRMMETLATGVDDGRTKTSGVLEALCKYYHSSAPEVNRVWLCSHLDHFSNSGGDKGWGCGFRNFQMLLSSMLLNDAFKNRLQDCRSIPCIPKIQCMIENAWKEGFDPQGASHFNSRLQGTKAWIGACEIYCLLTSLQLKSQILDFHKPSSSSGTHPLLFEWVLNYYSSDTPCGNGRVVCTSRPAIYLQHQGHSRTIVGIEERKNKTCCLLIFDPGCPPESMHKLLKQNIDGSALKSLRKYVGALKHKQYQIVAVEGVLSAEEKAVRLQMSKTFKAERIP
ncbi:zinc finger-containing ubiquitin peptidase 1 [Pelodytes ibericus]